MATIDERVVSMKFDNRGFAEGVGFPGDHPRRLRFAPDGLQ